jgi:hypothetical protein
MAEELDAKEAARQAAADKANRIFAIVLLVPLAVAALAITPMVMRRSSTGVTAVVDRLNEDDGVKRSMGEPISAGWVIDQENNYHRQKGVVHFEIPVEGTHHAGTAFATGVESGGVWGWTELRVVIEGGTTIRLIGN